MDDLSLLDDPVPPAPGAAATPAAQDAPTAPAAPAAAAPAAPAGPQTPQRRPPPAGPGGTPLSTPSRRKLDSTQMAKQLYSQYYRRYHLLIEYKNLANPVNFVPGVYVMPSEDNLYLWHGAIFVSHGYWAGGVYKFNVEIPSDYPESGPIVRFTSPSIYHPLVNQHTLVFRLGPPFDGWRQHEHTISKVLQHLARSFSGHNFPSLDESQCPNREALRLFKSDVRAFIDRCSVSVRGSQQDAVHVPGINFVSISSQQERDAVDAIFGETVPILLRPDRR